MPIIRSHGVEAELTVSELAALFREMGPPAGQPAAPPAQNPPRAVEETQTPDPTPAQPRPKPIARPVATRRPPRKAEASEDAAAVQQGDIEKARQVGKSLSPVKRVIAECVLRHPGLSREAIKVETSKDPSEISRALASIKQACREAGLRENALVRFKQEGKQKLWFPGRLLIEALNSTEEQVAVQ